MSINSKYWAILMVVLAVSIKAQETTIPDESAFRFSGQLSGWGQYSPDAKLEGWLGGRYLPQLNYRIPLSVKRLIDFEASANIWGDSEFHSSFSTIKTNGNIRPYRSWGRYSSSRMEIRAGLQKINFGSALMFRPLMWFDGINPRDPLQITDGVWGILFRYYFQNNANLWFWSLYGNKDPKGLEISPTYQHTPEAGGRIQIPVSHGEAALSYHFRRTDTRQYDPFSEGLPNISGESRLGFDTRLDITVGLWAEGSWTHLHRNAGAFTNQEMITVGTDYTIGIGNGLSLTFEQMVYSYDQQAFAFNNTLTLTGLNLSYPIGLFDNLRGLVYYDWNHNEGYYFADWQRQFNHLTFHLMAYWNPKTVQLLTLGMNYDRFAGKGVQLMIVWNH